MDKKELTDMLSEFIQDVATGEMERQIEIPPNPKLGDFAFPCFTLAKLRKKSPALIAEELKEIIKNDLIERTEVVGGYLNFFVNKQYFIEKTLDGIQKAEKPNIGQGKNIVIDYASLNIAKPFHIGHLKNAVTGDSLYRIFEYVGYKPIGINHLGDMGTQFGKLIVAYKLWGDEARIEERGIYELVDLYVKFHEEAEKSPSLEDDGRSWSYKIEKGDPEAIKIWNYFKEISIKYFDRVSAELNLHFDYITGESFYLDKVDHVVSELESKNLLVESQGAKIVELEEMAPAIIVRSDGATLYMTRDIAAAIYRKETFDFDKCIYITGSEQKLHFAQWFKVIEKMGYSWASDLAHIAHGMVRLEGGNLSTRTGNIIKLEDAIKEATKKVETIIDEKNPNAPNKEEIAKMVGVGALVFHNLFNSSNKDVVFKWEEALRFDGETGPYLQYTHARLCSLIRKANDTGKVDYDLLKDETSFELIKHLSKFNEIVINAATRFEPSFVARYLIDLAQYFNKFYNEYAILVEDDLVQNTRIQLVKATQKILKEGLSLICMQAPEEM